MNGDMLSQGQEKEREREREKGGRERRGNTKSKREFEKVFKMKCIAYMYAVLIDLSTNIFKCYAYCFNKACS